MELVRQGTPIDRYCDEGALSIAARLRLFLLVCDAVDHAHRNMILHLDIKPANILIAGDGVPKLLDFGIAKLIPSDDNEEGTLSTTGLRPLTPRYASPEQLRGEPLTAASDVYSLGVVLYKLLCGQAPFRVDSLLPSGIAPAIDDTAPDRPSEVVARNADIDREIPRDLDTVSLMALHKEPQRRYASAARLAEDIRAYLDGRPVRARDDTWAYRATKFVLRNKLAVAASILIFSLIAGFSVVMAHQAANLATERDRVQQERDAAEQARARSDRVAGFWSGLFYEANPADTLRGSLTARELLERGAAKLASSPSQDLEVRATLQLTMGRIGRDRRAIWSGPCTGGYQSPSAGSDSYSPRSLCRSQNVALSSAEDFLGRARLSERESGQAAHPTWRLRRRCPADRARSGHCC